MAAPSGAAGGASPPARTGVTVRTKDGATNGLGPEEVQTRIIAGQINTTPPAPGRTFAQILRANVLTRFNAILGSLLVVVAVVGPFQDGLFGVVLVANTAIGILQELRAKRTLDRLAILTAPRAHVVREGQVVELPLDQVVLDDVLELGPGDQVPVDAIVLACDGLEIDESLLSGEAEPVTKKIGDPVLSGSFVVAGAGRVRATGVGEAAYASSLEAQARRFSLIHSELQKGTNQILRMVTWVMVPAGGALVASQLLRSHQALGDALRGSVAGVAAMVPEGLVLLTSIAFAAGALRLARQRVLVQELAAIEGLARVDVVCIDKTGTLTEPGMQLESIDLLADRSRGSVEEVVGAIAVSDPTPNATMRALAAIGPPPQGWTVDARVPFSSTRKWSAVTFAGRGTWILGAPEVIAATMPAGALSSSARHQASGRRVLLLAETTEASKGTRLPAALDPIALLVLAEHLRSDAATTVRYLLEQDITVKVLSGDAPETVSAIASLVGVPSIGEACDASGLAENDTALGAALEATNVFGRVRPEQKVAAVRELQAQGHVVAMVGDGVNDVQALKEADLGIAMGSGSQSSRSVARVVLLDNSFSAVPQILGRGPAGDRQHRASRQSLRHEDRLCGPVGSCRRHQCRPLPILPAPSHHREHPHDRGPRILSCPVPGSATLITRIHPQSAQLHDPGGTGCRGFDLHHLRHRQGCSGDNRHPGPYGGDAGAVRLWALGARPDRPAAGRHAYRPPGNHGRRAVAALRRPSHA